MVKHPQCLTTSLIATSLAVGGTSYFLDAHDTGSMQKTADNCAVLCKESIRKAEEMYGCSIKSVVTDNAKNMEKMRDKLADPGFRRGGFVHSEGGVSYRNFRSGSKLLQGPGQINKQKKIADSRRGGFRSPKKKTCIRAC